MENWMECFTQMHDEDTMHHEDTLQDSEAVKKAYFKMKGVVS